MTDENPFDGLVLADELRLMPPDLRAALTPADIQEYIDKGADIHARDARGNTALMWAVTRCAPETITFFIDKGIDVNAGPASGSTPFMWAAYADISLAQKRKVLHLLLAHGADPSRRDHNDRDAEALAREYGDEMHAAAVREEIRRFQHEQQQRRQSQQRQQKLRGAAPHLRFKP